MSLTDILILCRYWRPSSYLYSRRRRPSVRALSLFRQGLVRYYRESSISSAMSSGPRRMSSGTCLFFFVVVVRALFACDRGLSVSLTGPLRALSQYQLFTALAVLGLPLWRSRLGSMRDLRRPCSPRRPTCLESRGSWSRTDWSVDRKLRTLRAFLESDLGAASRSSGGYTVES